MMFVILFVTGLVTHCVSCGIIWLRIRRFGVWIPAGPLNHQILITCVVRIFCLTPTRYDAQGSRGPCAHGGRVW